MHWTTLAPLALATALAAAPLCAAPPAGEEELRGTVLFSLDRARPGDSLMAALRLEIPEGLHLYGPDDPEEERRVRLEVLKTPGLRFGPVEYPATEEKEILDEVVREYSGTQIFRIPVTVGGDAPGGSAQVRLKLFYQACTDQLCYAPTHQVFEAGLPLAPAGAEVLSTHAEVFRKAAGGPGSGDVPGGSDLESALQRSLLLALGLAFVGGLLASLTPCVYPMIPVTISYFARETSRSRGRTLALALTYVLGICVTYSALGLMSGLGGQTFGSYLGNRWVLGSLAAFVFAMGLSMFGLFEVQLPASLRNRLGGKGRAGFLGALFMGLVLGLIAAPCVGPALVAILAWIAKTRDPVLGTLFLFTFALGMGVLFVALAMGANFLPRSGGWMDTVKKGMGVALFGVAVYFLSSGFPAGVVALVSLGTALGLAAHFLRPHLRRGDGERPSRAGGIAGLAFLALAAWFGLGLARPGWGPLGGERLEAAPVNWVLDPEEGLRLGKAEGRPVFLDFTARWCVACKEMERFVIETPEVAEELRRFVAVKVDCTEPGSPGDLLLKDHGFTGLPSYAFHDSKGNLLADRGFSGKKSREEFLVLLRSIR